MGAHRSETNAGTDPTGANQNLHVPGYTGTSTQRLAYPTANLRVSEQWYETDTMATYQWQASLAWVQISGGGGESNNPGASVTITGSLVVGMYMSLGSGVVLTLPSAANLTVI